MINTEKSSSQTYANEYERIYAQLCMMKERLNDLEKEIQCKKNQFLLIYRNTENHHDIDLVASAGYDRFLTEIKRFRINRGMDYFENSYKRCNDERTNIVAHLSRIESDGNIVLEMLENALSWEYIPSRYSMYKKRINEFKEIVLNTPLQLIRECFDAEIIRPKSGETFNEDTMDKICESSYEVIGDLKQLRHKKLGTFVDECVEFGAIDKTTGKYIITPAVTTSVVELAEKFTRFHFVK